MAKLEHYVKRTRSKSSAYVIEATLFFGYQQNEILVCIRAAEAEAQTRLCICSLVRALAARIHVVYK